MNSLMLIRVQVDSASALARLRAVEAQSHRTASGVGGIGRQAQWGLPYLSKWGNQVQWAGRQLMYNFTLPIALATAAGTKFALENEKAMVRVEKVYGDASKRFDQLAKTEIPALADAFEALSNRFGVHQAEVIGIAGDWAAAGASGIALAKSVKLTLETMVLGELEAVDATKQLIAIQAQYGFNVTQLTRTIDILNMVENQTGASMRDLMDGMARAAGVARVAGVDVEHLSAMMAALVPAAGSAASAGNALKTIISRILSPTTDAVKLLKEMGVAVSENAWQSQDAGKRLEALAEEFDNLSSAQKTHMATVLGSRWQLNRLVILMQAVRNENSYYNKALKSTSDRQAIFTQRQKELQKVLESNPQRIQQAWVILQNSMADVIVPLLPYITYLISELARLANAFANLDGETQKMILAGLGFLAIIGPIARYVGALSNLFGLLSGAAHFFGAAMLGLIGFVFKPFALLTAGAGLATKALGVFRAALAISLGKTVIGASKNVLMLGAIFKQAGKFFTFLLTPFRAFTGVFVAIWAAALTKIRTIWASFTVLMRIMWAAMWLGMTTATGAAMTGIRGLVSAGGAAIVAAWKVFTAATQLVSVTGRAAIIIIWATMMTSLRTMIAGMGRGVAMAWYAFNRSLIVITAATAAGMKVIWAAMIASFRAVPAAIAAVLVSLRGMVIKMFASIVVAIRAFIPLLLRAITGPWGLAITAVLTLILMFRDKVAEVWNAIKDAVSDIAGFEAVGRFFAQMRDWILDAFWALPEGVRSAMIAVLTVVRDAALTIYDWMSYLNPWARHSPSLVDQVTSGMDEIDRQYARSKGATQHFKSAQKNLEQAIAAQEKVVHRWDHALGNANRTLDLQQSKLGRLQGKLDSIQAAYDRHADAVSRLSDAPIKGMGAMSDKIFENELAQKKLRLEMLKFEKVNGSIEDVRSRLDALRGDIELLQGNAAELRSAGAGSDVLGPIEAQIAAMEKEARALQNTVNNNPVDELQKQMDDLARQGEILQLQNDIKYDPMIRSIEELANAQKELSYDQIVSGIKRHQEAMDALEPSLRRATNAVDAQQKVVDAATARRDRIQRIYDREQDQLEHLKDRYNHLTDAMNKNKDAASALAKSKADLPVAIETFRAGAGANWPDPGGMAKIGREGGLKDQSALIEQFTQDTLTDMNSIFGGFDMFGPLKRWWARTWDWLKSNVGPRVEAVAGAIRDAVAAAGDPIKRLLTGGVDNGFTRGLSNFADIVIDIFKTIGRWAGYAWKLFGPDIKRIWNAFVQFGKDIWNEVGPELEKFRGLWEPLGKAMKNIWRIVKPLIGLMLLGLAGSFKIVASVISRVLPPVLDFVVGVMKNLVKVLRGVIEFLIGVFTLDFKMAWRGIVDIVEGAFGLIWSAIKNAAKVVWGVVSGFVMGIVDFFKWLYDVLVGHSIVPDMVNGIIDIFGWLADLAKWVWNKVLKPIYNVFKELWKDYIKPFLKFWWSGIKAEWAILKKVAGWLWDNVLKPIWNKVKDLWDVVKAALKTWWDGIRAVWTVLKAVGKWLWDNVLNPVWQRVKALWNDYVKPSFKGWWEGIKSVWAGLKTAGKWIWDNVMSPVYDKIKEGWTKVRDWLAGAKDMFTKPVEAIVNVVVKAVNAMINGLNKISDVLPGIDFHINTIPLLASGGTIPSKRVGAGFKTNGARAIVGEGNSNYPEFVVPTDPRFRDRARTLLQAAAARLGATDAPAFARGGILPANAGGFGLPNWGDIKGAISGTIQGIKSVGEYLEKHGRDALVKLASPFINQAREMLSKVNWNIPKAIGMYGLETVEQWIKGAAAAFQSKENALSPSVSGNISKKGWTTPASSYSIGEPPEWRGGYSGHTGQDLPGALGTIIRATHPGTVYFTTYPGSNPYNDTPYRSYGKLARVSGSGMMSYYAHLDDFVGTSRKVKAGETIGRMGMNGNATGVHLHYELRNAQGLVDPINWHKQVGAPLAKGGIVRRTPFGILARIGEGDRDEAVLPLPKNWRSTLNGDRNGGGSKIYNFYGDLEFPNITDGNDASTFLKNLEILADN